MKHKEHTILAVDDSPENLQIINNLLSTKYNIKLAKDGKTALKIIYSDNPPDLILLDICMPNMDGYQICEQVKKNNKSKEIPVIFVTAKGEIEDEEKGFNLGAVDYITKPVTPSILLARVKTHLTLKKINLCLRNQNQQLEKLVLERTEELHKKNHILKKTLHERNLLLNEIHHRIGNNLQIMSSLLQLRKGDYQEKEGLSIINDYQNLINVYSMVHNELYKQSNFIDINISNFIEAFNKYLKEKYQTHQDDTFIKINETDCLMDINTAIPFSFLLYAIIIKKLKKKNTDYSTELHIKEEGDNYIITFSNTNLNETDEFTLTSSAQFDSCLIDIMLDQLKGKTNTNQQQLTIIIKKREATTYHKLPPEIMHKICWGISD